MNKITINYDKLQSTIKDFSTIINDKATIRFKFTKDSLIISSEKQLHPQESLELFKKIKIKSDIVGLYVLKLDEIDFLLKKRKKDNICFIQKEKSILKIGRKNIIMNKCVIDLENKNIRKVKLYLNIPIFKKINFSNNSSYIHFLLNKEIECYVGYSERGFNIYKKTLKKIYDIIGLKKIDICFSKFGFNYKRNMMSIYNSKNSSMFNILLYN